MFLSCTSSWYAQPSELLYLVGWKGPSFEIVSWIQCFAAVVGWLIAWFCLVLVKAI